MDRLCSFLAGCCALLAAGPALFGADRYQDADQVSRHAGRQRIGAQTDVVDVVGRLDARKMAAPIHGNRINPAIPAGRKRLGRECGE